MAELRSVDPRTLKPDPNNPRTTQVPKAMDHQLVASILAIGLLQPPVVREVDGALVIRAGHRRVKAVIAAKLSAIDVYVIDGPDDLDPMASFAENNIRVGLNPVDTWRAIDRLEQQGWNEQAIADALALPPRTIRKMTLLGRLHPPLLDAMAKGSMPDERQLRIIANALLNEQEEVWQRHKPKRGQQPDWWNVSGALRKDRIPFSAARFDDAIAQEYGVVWEDDLFAPADEEGRYTTNVEGFTAAQEASMRAAMPANGVALTLDRNRQPALPKGAERVWSEPTETDRIGFYVDSYSHAVKTIAFRLAQPKFRDAPAPNEADAPTHTVVPIRPDITQKGRALIGEYRTAALRQALDGDIPLDTLVGLLVLTLAADNVSIQPPDHSLGYDAPKSIADRITEGGVITADTTLLGRAARDMLKHVLSCRENSTSSGTASRIAGDVIGADRHLPDMGTEEFLSCLSRQKLGRLATEANVLPRQRVKDTRAALVANLREAGWHLPEARFRLTAEEAAKARQARIGRVFSASGHLSDDDDEMPDEDADLAPVATNPETESAAAAA